MIFSSNNGGSYMHDALYESYIQAKIDAEDRLAFALKESMVISEADYANIRALQEAKIGDKVISTWKKFIAFIKSMIARFMENMTNVVLNEKDYLEKYRDIIIHKKPKFGKEMTFDGNHKVAINRLIAVEAPLFDYAKYQKELEEPNNEALINKIMQPHSGFSYDSAKEPAELFKSYFLALNKGPVKINIAELKQKDMEDMYNFCHDFHKMQSIVDKDINNIDKSTDRIEKMIQEMIPEKVDEAFNNIVYEKVDIVKNDTPSSSPINKMNSTNDEDPDTEKKLATDAVSNTNNKSYETVSKAAQKWRNVCSAFISSKLTACEIIANDYMKIIRAHVRSYGGADKKDTSNDVGSTGGTKYTKAAARAKLDAENANKEVEKNK